MIRALKSRAIALIALCVISLASCTAFIGEDPDSDPVAVYDFFWTALNRDYAGFYTKAGTDWDAIRQEGRSDVVSDPTELRLRFELHQIIYLLDDGHMRLDAGGVGVSVIPDFSKIPFDFDVAVTYVGDTWRWDSTGHVFTGFLDGDTGYMYIPTFAGSNWAINIPTELDRFAGIPNLVLDLRNNGGGQSANAQALVEEFIDAPHGWGRYIERMGPDIPAYHGTYSLVPAPGAPRAQRLVVLMNEGSCSSTDMAIAGLRAFTDAYFIGKPTRAELIGNNVARELPNGWVLRLGTVNNLMIEDGLVDGDVLPVDVNVTNTMDRLKAGHDDQLEAALAFF